MAPTEKTSSISLRGVLSALALAIGTMHLLVAPGRAHDWSWEGAALAAVGVVQIVLGLGMVVAGRRWLTAGIAAALVPSAVLVIVRTTGYPFGPFDGYSPNMTSYEYVLIAGSVVLASLIGGALLAGPESMGATGLRFDNLAPMIVIAAAIPGIAVSGWVDDASHVVGSRHVHTSAPMPISLTATERASLGAQLETARAITTEFPDLRTALNLGWVTVGSPARGVGQMVVMPDSPESDPTAPFALLFAGAEDDSPIVGLQYTIWDANEPPLDLFTGQQNMWHLHPTSCVVDGTEGQVEVPLDDPITGADCGLVGGRLSDHPSFMLRVWAVPGWENPAGTFAHDHPDV